MICLFGGTFDPVHRGHVHAALTVCEALGVSEIRMILSAHPSHRKTPGTSVDERWKMLQLACADDCRLVADDTEIRRGTPSYTVDTLEELREAHPRETLVWVIGSDAYSLLPSWYRWRRVLELCHLLVLQRPGHALRLEPAMESLTEAATVGDVEALLSTEHGHILVLEREMQQIAAESIRRAIAEGRNVDHLLPAAVATYIGTHALYKG